MSVRNNGRHCFKGIVLVSTITYNSFSVACFVLVSTKQDTAVRHCAAIELALGYSQIFGKITLMQLWKVFSDGFEVVAVLLD